jgi:hypothetical protein
VGVIKEQEAAMNPALILTFVVLAVAALAVALYPLVRSWARARGPRQVTCPQTGLPVAVEVDPVDAAFHAVLGTRELHLRSCTRWPEKAGCGQECLAEIAAAPDGCLLRLRLAAWYQDKTCALCGKPFHDVHAWEHRPALLGPDRTPLTWDGVRAEQLDEILATHQPICWDCEVVEWLYRNHPELVVERPAHRGEGRSAANL